MALHCLRLPPGNGAAAAGGAGPSSSPDPGVPRCPRHLARPWRKAQPHAQRGVDLTRVSAIYGRDFWVEAPVGVWVEAPTSPVEKKRGSEEPEGATSRVLERREARGRPVWVEAPVSQPAAEEGGEERHGAEAGPSVSASSSSQADGRGEGAALLHAESVPDAGASGAAEGDRLEAHRRSNGSSRAVPQAPGSSTDVQQADGAAPRAQDDSGVAEDTSSSVVPAPPEADRAAASAPAQQQANDSGGFLGLQLGDFFGGLFGGKQETSDLVEIKGTVMLAKKNILDFVSPTIIADNVLDVLGRRVELQLVSVHLHPDTKQIQTSSPSAIENWAFSEEVLITGEDDPYPITFKVPPHFGEPGAILVKNNHTEEFYLTSITLTLPDSKTVEFSCNSWVYPSSYYPDDRVFFSNKHYLPCETPEPLKALRERDLAEKRGDGKGERKPWERIYDYDVYNDLCNPDANPPVLRPILGGSKKYPYPRRLRTGRAKCKRDSRYELPVFMLDLEATYKPRDEVMSRKNYSSFLAAGLKGAVHAIMPAIFFQFDDTPNEFDSMSEITDLYDKGLDLENSLEKTVDSETWGSGTKDDPMVLIQQLSTSSGGGNVIQFPKPQVIAADEKAWMTDEEFGHQVLAGMHPCHIERLREFPPKSIFPSDVYGPASGLTREHIEPFLNGLTVEKAMEQKKLFMLDYDILRGDANRITALGEAKIYASRTILLLNEEKKMKPVAIELILPPCHTNGTPGSMTVVTAPPEEEQEKDYRWLLAKIHVGSADLGFHELFSHWVSTHAVLEPFIISLHRNLSVAHPIHAFLLPYTRNTILMNGIGRQSLINADGIIERSTAPGKYGLEMSSTLYGLLWHFDRGNLPLDLLARGMADPSDDPHAPGGVKLVVDDYPYAVDGLELWSAIAKWVRAVVHAAYQGSDAAVRNDAELQRFWTEAITVGHADLAAAPWWPALDSVRALESALTNLAWTAGPKHAAVNFGQYAYAGYMPNRCPRVRRLVPEPGSPEHAEALADPDNFLLSCLATESVTAVALLTTEVLSNHSVDEEYLGQRNARNWTADPAVLAAFKAFGDEVKAIAERIKERNRDPELFNRRGPAKVPYTLLYPFSGPGVTGRGVPNSPCV